MDKKLPLIDRLRILREKAILKKQAEPEPEPDSDSESTTSSESDLSWIEDDDRELIDSLENRIDNFKFFYGSIDTMLDNLESDIQDYRHKKQIYSIEQLMTPSVPTISETKLNSDSSFHIIPIIGVWLTVTIFNYSLKNLFDKMFK